MHTQIKRKNAYDLRRLLLWPAYIYAGTDKTKLIYMDIEF